MNLAKSIIQEALIPFHQEFMDAFRSTVAQVSEDLFERARVAVSNNQEQDVYEQYRLIKKQYAQLVKYADMHIGDMPNAMLHSIDDESHGESDESLLSIVGYSELDVVLAYSQLESLLDVRFYNQLYLLEKRNQALFAYQALDKTNMPFGSASISWILKKALSYDELNPLTQVMLINQMATAISVSLEKTFQQINGIYADYRILPNLKIQVKKGTGSSSSPNAQQQDNAEVIESSEEGSSNASIKPSQAPVVDNAQPIDPGKLSNQKISEIFELLQQLRPVEESQPESNITPTVLDESLSRIDLPTDQLLNSDGMQQLKEVLGQDITNRSGVYYPVLNQNQESAMDVMAYAFDQITTDEALDQNVLASLNQLQVPLIRTAVQDNDFFDDETHPARKFLEKVLSASHAWHGTKVVKDIEKFSNLVYRDFNGDKNTFTQVEADLDKYLQMVANKAANAEKKHKAQVLGRERLKKIHAAVDKFINQLLDINNIGFIEHLLDYVLKDTLTLTLLREGKDSIEWQEQSDMVKNIVRMTHVKHHQKVSEQMINATLAKLETNMYNLGFVKSDVDQTIDELNNYHDLVKNRYQSAQKTDEKNSHLVNEPLSRDTKPDVESLLDPPLVNEAFSHLKKSADVSNAKKSKHQVLEEIRPLSSEEILVMEKVKKYPFGSLFDFKHETADQRRKKMCWLSPVSNFALFLNPLGKQPLEKPIPQLAIDIVEGVVEYVEPQEKGFFAKALDKVYEKLKKMKQGIGFDESKSPADGG